MLADEAMILVVGLLAFLGVVALVPLALRVAVAYGVTDVPMPGKLHSTATPYLGGMAVALAVAGASPLLPAWSMQGAAILIGALLVAAVGLVDDLRTLGPVPRLAVEGVAASIAFAGGVRVELAGGPVDFVLTVGALVLVTNSFNLLDNMDGVVGSVGATMALPLLAAALLEGQVFVGGLAALVAGACAGFLVYNWHPARIFLGDAGSLFVGFLLGAIALKLRFAVAPPASVAVVALLLGPALFDTTLVVVSRLRAGRPIFLGGTDHTAHRLLMLGLCCQTVAALLVLATATCAVLGLAVGRGVLPAWPVVGAVVAVGLAALVAFLRMPVYEGRAGREMGEAVVADVQPAHAAPSLPVPEAAVTVGSAQRSAASAPPRASCFRRWANLAGAGQTQRRDGLWHDRENA